MSACPSAADLLALLDETLPDERTQHIIAHLEQCPACDARLQDLTQADPTLLGAVRRAASLPRTSEESELECWLAVVDAGRLAARRPAGEHAGELRPGQLIGPYRLVRRIGQGGMGVVFEAVHTRLEKTVALKLIQQRWLSRADAVQRFDREMRAVGRLAHPHLVTAFDAGKADDVHYLAMELVTGTDLGRLLAESQKLSIAAVCDMMRQTALVLDYIHRQGLVHRDVKPANLMRTADGQIKLLDLGLAKVTEDARSERLTDQGQFLGTLDFIAPEQAEDGHHVDHRADLYSLGATFYALLTGNSPFASGASQGLVQKLAAILHKTPQPVSTRRADVPQELSALIDRLLAKSPDDRPGSAAEVAALLEPYVPAATLAPASSPARSGLLRASRGSALWVTAVVLLVGALSFLLLRAFNPSDTASKSRQSGRIGTPNVDPRDPVAISSPPAPNELASQQSGRLNIDDARCLLFRAGRATTFGQIGFGGNPLDRLEPAPELPRVGDRFRLEVQLSQPAHLAMLVLHPDGTTAEYIDPVDAKVDQYQFPASADRDYHLQEGAGALAIVMLCSNAAISPARIEAVQTAAAGWSTVRIDGIWRFDGQRWQGRDPLRAEGPGGAPPAALTRLAAPMTEVPELVRALVLPVLPADAHASP